MVLDRADRHDAGRLGERRSVHHNPDLLARATREIRVLRLEHDPQPGLDGYAYAWPRFLRVLVVGRAGRRCPRMSLKGVGRFAKAPWRQENWPQVTRHPAVLAGPALRAGVPAARTRQIQIRNRQHSLHTAGGGEWQAGPSGGQEPDVLMQIPWRLAGRIEQTNHRVLKTGDREWPAS